MKQQRWWSLVKVLLLLTAAVIYSFPKTSLSLRVVKLRLTLLFWKWLREMEEELEKREAQTERLNLAAC